jgi:hypothetical protein
LAKYTIQEVVVNTVNTGKKPYSVAEATYTTDRGENKTKKIMSFSNPAVFATLSKIKHPTVVETEHDGAPYYNWTSIKIVSEEEAPTSKVAGVTSVKVAPSTYETAEERKIKQLYIVRQSSITNALTYLKDKDSSVEEVLTVAQEFVDFVYGNKFEELDSVD